MGAVSDVREEFTSTIAAAIRSSLPLSLAPARPSSF
jgi:hypothetical protein